MNVFLQCKQKIENQRRKIKRLQAENSKLQHKLSRKEKRDGVKRFNTAGNATKLELPSIKRTLESIPNNIKKDAEFIAKCIAAVFDEKIFFNPTPRDSQQMVINSEEFKFIERKQISLKM